MILGANSGSLGDATRPFPPLPLPSEERANGAALALNAGGRAVAFADAACASLAFAASSATPPAKRHDTTRESSLALRGGVRCLPEAARKREESTLCLLTSA